MRTDARRRLPLRTRRALRDRRGFRPVAIMVTVSDRETGQLWYIQSVVTEEPSTVEVGPFVMGFFTRPT